MNPNTSKALRSVAALGLMAAIMSACSETSEPSTGLQLAENLEAKTEYSPSQISTEPALLRKSAWVCKVGPSANFSWTVNGGTPSSTLINDGACKIIVFYDFIGEFDEVIVTEEVPAGTYLDSIVPYYMVDGVITKGATIYGTNTTSGNVSMNGGFLLVYHNGTTPPPPPPPPPSGGEGCTPGYWKQSQHFDSWPAAYTPGMLFSAVFEDAFPGKTLLQVLGQGGGGLNALGRHTVAALLNSGNSGVSYDLNTAGVISAFNGVFPGGNYEGQKNIFAGFNEQGCPLN